MKITNIYVDETKLKSLLIRVKNKKNNVGSLNHNKRLEELIATYLNVKKLSFKKPELTTKKTKLKNHLRDRIIKLSEITQVNEKAYDEFAKCILLMIKNILTKPQFSGYTYKDDFYSDATFKILKYITNYDHKIISKITQQPVNAFSYISQIIHNSIIYIINEHKKYTENLRLEYDRKKTILNISKKQFFNDERYERPSDIRIKRYINNEHQFEQEIERINNMAFNDVNCEISYVIANDLYENIVLNDKENNIYQLYKKLQNTLFDKFIPTKFYWSNNMEELVFESELPDLSNNITDVNKDQYPKILDQLKHYIAKRPSSKIIDVVYDFCLKNSYSTELIGEIISTDNKLKKSIENDRRN